VDGVLRPIKIHDVSVGKTHVAVTLDNAVVQPDAKFGRDVLVFGQFLKSRGLALPYLLCIDLLYGGIAAGNNTECQLGLPKRSNVAIPQHPMPLPYSASPVLAKDKGTVDEFGSGTTSPVPHRR
jgi:hypothetical protein